MSAAAVPISPRMRRRHVAHRISLGQALFRLIVAWVLAMGASMVTYTAMRFVAVTIAPMQELGPTHSSLIWTIVAILAGFLTIAALLCWVTQRLFMTAVPRIMAEFRAALRGALPQAQAAQPLSAEARRDAVPAMIGSAAVVCVVVFAAVGVSWDSLQYLPLILWPALPLATVALLLTMTKMLSQVVDWVEAWSGWISWIPVIGRMARKIRLNDPYCPLCDLTVVDTSRREILRRRLRRLGARVGELSDRSVWFAFLRRRPVTLAFLVVSLALIGCLMATGSDFSFVFGLVSLAAGMTVGRLAITRGPSVLDSLFEHGGTWRESLCSLGGLIVAILLMLNFFAVRGVVEFLRGPVTYAFHTYDANAAWVLVAMLEVVALWAMMSAIIQRGGQVLEWSPRRVLTGSFLPLLTVATAVVAAPLAITLMLLLVTFLAASSRDFREGWRNRTDADA